MGNFKFKSQIYTTKEQSERLLALGLKKETADIGLAGDIPIAIEDWKTQDTTLIDSPAWSLDRLIHIAKGKRGIIIIRVGESNYTALIKRIEYLIKQGTFNKDYLEDKK